MGRGAQQVTGRPSIGLRHRSTDQAVLDTALAKLEKVDADRAAELAPQIRGEYGPGPCRTAPAELAQALAVLPTDLVNAGDGRSAAGG